MTTTITGTSITKGTSAPSGPNAGDMWFNTSEDVASMMVYSGASWAPMSNKFSGNGGTETTLDGYKIHTFTSSGTFVAEASGEVEYLVIAGGGTGGQGYGGGAGGGGAGGYRTAVGFPVSAQSYTVTVGAGGAPVNGNVAGNSGGNSTFSTITSIGGGGGTSQAQATGGGSGGGGGEIAAWLTGGAGTSGQGNAGGNGTATGGNAGAGGGGAGAAGGNSSYPGGVGPGGVGLSSAINGTATVRAGGGGASGNTIAGSSGGSGGGGNGGTGAGGGSSGTPTSGAANTGGGGGGTYQLLKGTISGGSGIVIIRYAV